MLVFRYTTYRLVALFDQISTHGIPAQGSAAGNQERLAVGSVEDLSEETHAVAEDGGKGW